MRGVAEGRWEWNGEVHFPGGESLGATYPWVGGFYREGECEDGGGEDGLLSSRRTDSCLHLAPPTGRSLALLCTRTVEDALDSLRQPPLIHLASASCL